MNTIKRSLLFCITVLACFFVMSSSNEKPHQTILEVRKLIDNDKPSNVLLDLLEACSLQHDGSLASIVQETQRAFLRPAGKERWELEDMIKIPQEKAQEFFKALGLVHEVKPMQMQYDYAFLMGALVGRVRMRLQYLVNLHKNGVHFRRLIILGGARPLDAQMESSDTLLNPDTTQYPLNPSWHAPQTLPKTEIEMMQMVYEQMDLPKDFRAIPLDIVNTPMQQKDGALLRPTTVDIVNQWLATNPAPGTILMSSNQPYVGFQDAAARALVPSSFILETVGKATQESNQALYFDSLARWLFMEKARLEKNR